MSVLSVCLYVYRIRDREGQNGELDPRTGVMDGCEPQCGCWELNLGHPKEQPIFLTAEPSLQSTILLGMYASEPVCVGGWVRWLYKEGEGLVRKVAPGVFQALWASKMAQPGKGDCRQIRPLEFIPRTLPLTAHSTARVSPPS